MEFLSKFPLTLLSVAHTPYCPGTHPCELLLGNLLKLLCTLIPTDWNCINFGNLRPWNEPWSLTHPHEGKKSMCSLLYVYTTT